MRLGMLTLCVLVSLPVPAVAAESRLGKVTATAPTAQNNATTAVAFTVPSGTRISIQCDADVHVAVSQSSTALATAEDVKIASGSLFPTSTPKSAGVPSYVSILPVSGTANCRVYVRSGDEV